MNQPTNQPNSHGIIHRELKVRPGVAKGKIFRALAEIKNYVIKAFEPSGYSFHNRWNQTKVNLQHNVIKKYLYKKTQTKYTLGKVVNSFQKINECNNKVERTIGDFTMKKMTIIMLYLNRADQYGIAHEYSLGVELKILT